MLRFFLVVCAVIKIVANFYDTSAKIRLLLFLVSGFNNYVTPRMYKWWPVQHTGPNLIFGLKQFCYDCELRTWQY